jgi:hypothetical protein
MLESAFQRQALVRLKSVPAVGGLWLPYPRTKFAKAGVSDLVFVTAACELKAPGSKYGITETQEAFLQKLNAAGGLGGLVSSFEGLESFVREFSIKKSGTYVHVPPGEINVRY